MSLHYTLHLSGPPQVLAADVVIHGFESEKALALLAYLALVERPVNREHLAGLFWGELDAEHSRGNLRRVLHNLTQRLPGCLEVERHSVRFIRAAATVDVREFRRQHQAGDLDALQAALSWCGGELLEGIALADCPEFELWLVGERERWRAEVLAALDTVIADCTRRGAYPTALDMLDRALALAPWLEHLHRQKALLLARQGRFTAALRQYELCRRILADELGSLPSHEFESLYTRIEAERRRPRSAVLQAPLLVGRTREMAELGALLLDPTQRLITITGLGGNGKSTLALAAAAVAAFAFLDGVLYASLLAITHPRELPALLLRQLGVTANGQEPIADQAVAALQSREVLLVLDNAEHLLPGASNHNAQDAVVLLQRLVAEAPNVKVLITSRQRLMLRCEHVLTLPGLAQSEDGAMALFWQRMAQYSPEPVRTVAEEAAAAHICALLDGSPLGIELAAAQCAQSSCAAVAASLHDSLDHLQAPWADLSPRQRSLRAIFDASWSLLAPAEQRSLAQLSLFASDFNAAAAHAVAEADVHMLARLADRSLLRATQTGGYALHPLVRSFAADRLATDASLTAAANDRFIRYHLVWLAARNLAATPARHTAIITDFSAEWSNVRAAWQALCANLSEAYRNDAHLTSALDALYHYCTAHSLFHEGRELLASFYAALPPHNVLLRGEVAVRLALLELRLGEPDQARRRLEAHVAALRALSPLPTATLALGALNLAIVALHQDRYAEVLQWSEQSRTHYQQLGNRWGEAMVLNVAGVGAFNRARYDQAQHLYTQAVAIFEALGDARWIAKVLHNLATSYDLTGDHSRALEHFTAALAIHRQHGEQWSEALALNSVGFVQINLGLYDAADEHLAAALQLFSAMGARWGEMMVLANRCLLDYLHGDLAAAEQAGHRAHDVAQALGDRRYQAYAAHRLGNVATAHARWDVAARWYMEALETRRALEQTALMQESAAALAQVALQRGDLAAARHQVAPIVESLDETPAGADEPLRIYLTCHDVLARTHDPQAPILLQRATALLNTRAARMTNAEWRAAYLSIAVHQELLQRATRESKQHE